MFQYISFTCVKHFKTKGTLWVCASINVQCMYNYFKIHFMQILR